MNISTVIISLNEEQHIEECVMQALRISEEVILIDAQSSDSTVDLARKAGAKVFIRRWEGFGKAKNFGNAQARNNWILSIDADEILSEDFIRNFKNVQIDLNTIYNIDIQTYYKGKALKHSGFYPLWKKRLFDKRKVQWNDEEVHEALLYDKEMKLKNLSGKVHHYSIKSKEEYIQKLDNYAKLGAFKMIEKGKKAGTVKNLIGPSFRFFKVYFLELGILDGKAGYELAVMFMRGSRAKLKYFNLYSKNRIEK